MKPMLAEQVAPEEAEQLCKSGEWIVEQKVDGVRCYVEKGKMFDRRGHDITARFPECKGLEQIKHLTLDGELITKSNSFTMIQSRVHLRDKFLITLSSAQEPAVFVAFDIVGSGTLTERKEELNKIAASGILPSWIMLVRELGEFESAWKMVKENGWEGVMIKRKSSKYEQRRSSEWRKVKAWEETVATFTKYEEHPKGITIETDDGRRVVINGAMAPKVKHEIIREGKVDCEIQYMASALIGSEAWRFPSFKRLVGDEE